MMKHRIFSVSVASVYPLYIAKAEKKGRTQAEVDEIFCWLTGHSDETLKAHLATGVTFEDFFFQAPRMNPRAAWSPASSAGCASRLSRSRRCARSAISTS
jgi:hypothetical protein